MILLVNQHTVPIFIDIVNAFAASGEKTVLFTGHIEVGRQPVSANVRIVRSKKYNRNSTFSRFVSWALFSLHYFVFGLFGKRGTRILVVTNPPFAPLITHWLRVLRNFNYYVLLYDLYPDAIVQAGILDEQNAIVRFWRKLNEKVFANAGLVLTLSDSMKQAALPYAGNSSGKFRIIPNWADLDYIRPFEKGANPFVKQHRLEGKKVVLYAGNMGMTHDLESLVLAAACLKENTDVVFVFVGDGAKRERLVKMAQERALKNVLFLPFQSASDFPSAMAAADIGIVTLGQGAEGISVPSKTYVNMAAGLALISIAPENSELNRLIQEHRVGLTYGPGDYLGLADGIAKLVGDEAMLSQLKTKSLATARKFTPANALEYVRLVSTTN